VLVRAADPLTRTTISSHLGSLPNIEVVPDEQRTAVNVVVVVAERLTAEVVSSLRRLKACSGASVVLIANEIDRTDLFTAAECNVVAVLPREAATSDRIEETVLTVAAGGGVLPSNVVGELLSQVERVQREMLSPHGLHTSGLTPREIDVLRLVSEGFDTAEIATKLSFSERAVKRVIFGVTNRLKLRNRPHAVAYAMRMGVI
jgi:DNA-binding NarL/FixJ family response regulator